MCMLSLVIYRIFLVDPLFTSDSEMHALANSEGPDEMPHHAAFHKGLHCLLRQKQSSEKEMQFYMEKNINL